MYKEYEEPLPPKFGRMYVSNEPQLDTSPQRKGDTVTFRAAEDVDFYVLVHSCEDGWVNGEIVAIGPDPAIEFNGWERSAKVQVPERVVTAIIRGD